MNITIDLMLSMAREVAGERVSVVFYQRPDGRIWCDVETASENRFLASAERSTASEAWAACIQQMRDA